MKRCVHTLVLLLFCLHAQAWTELSGNIRGIITNQESGQVVRGATLRLVPFEGGEPQDIAKTYSQDGGEYIFTNVAPGIYNLECTAFGYKTTRLVGIQVREDRTKLAYFKLNRGPAAEVDEIFTYASLEAQQRFKTKTTTATEEELGNAPATVYVVTSDQIEQRGYIGLQEVLQDIPEFQIQYYHSPEAFNVVSARGIFGNEKLLILIDGHRYNSMNSSRYSLMENYNIRYADRIEVIIGPASALYGADAYMGVINIITKRGNKVKGGGASVGYGLYNALQAHIEIGGGNEDFSVGAQMSYYRTDGPNFPNLYPDVFDWYNRFYSNNGAVLASTPNGTDSIIRIEQRPFFAGRQTFHVAAQLNYKQFSARANFNGVLHNSATGYGSQYAPYWQENRYGTIFVNLNAEQQYPFKKIKRLSARTLFDVSLYTLANTSKFINTLSNFQDAYRLAVDGGLRLTHSFNYRFSDKHRITVGLYGHYSSTLPPTTDLSRAPDYSYFPINPADPQALDIAYVGTDVMRGDSSLKIYQNFYYLNRIIGGAFVEYKAQLADPLYLTVGLRYDQIFDISSFEPQKSMRAYYNAGPRIGLVYRPWKPVTFKAFFGQGFLQPPPELKYRQNGRFFATTDNAGNPTIAAGYWQLPNENLQPERSNIIEASARYAKGDFSISVNGYYNVVSNAWVTTRNNDTTYFVGVAIPQSETITNAESRSIYYGTTINVAYRMVFGKEEQLKIRLNASYSDNDGNALGLRQLPFTAEHSAKGGVLVQFYNFSWYNSLLWRSVSYGEEVVDEDNNRAQFQSPAFFLWNSFMRYHLLNKKRLQLSLFAKVQNVLDSRYYNIANNSPISLGASPQDPFMIMGGITVNFGQNQR